ncbi:IclR family transcriptional regulator [Bordetella sp. N]|nr:IclR family transcriptional regulator [Bordetella sp. N]
MGDGVTAAEARTYAAPALEKGLDIIEILCKAETPLSQKDIAQQLGRSVGEIYRMLSCLVRRDYVAQTGDAYLLTTRLFELAHRHPPTHRLLVEAPNIMDHLATTLDQSCHLTVYGRGSQIVVAKIDAPSGMGFSMRTGAELDMLVSASGRVLLAFQDAATITRRIDECVRRRPDHADAGIGAILDAVRARGFESMPSNQVRGVLAIAFPILDSEGRAVAALSVPYVERIDEANRPLAEVHAATAAAAHDLTRRVGGTARA